MKTLWAFFIGVLSLTATAQVVTPKCEDSFKVFEGTFLKKEYNDAYVLLKDLRKRCPKVNEGLYKYGEVILNYQIEVANLPEEKKPFIEDLIALYNEQSANYPAGGAEVKKVLLQLDNNLIAKPEAYKALNTAFAKNKKSFTDYNSLLTYFNLFLEEYKAGKGISDDQYFEKYGEITSQVLYAQAEIQKEKDALLKKQETSTMTDAERQFIADAEPNIDALESVGDVIRNQSKDYVSCEKLEAFYDKNYEANKADSAWLGAMVTALYDKKCYKSALLKKGALALHQMKPSGETAHRLGMISLRKKGEIKEGVKYLEEAASFETTPARKAKIYFEIANAAKNTDKATAKNYILKTVELNPKAGDAYLLLAELYTTVSANDDCKLTDFDRKALSFLAIDTAKKAEIADPKYKSTVAAAVKRYSKNLPTKEEAKVLNKKKGSTITVGCWINETITLPKL